MIIDWGDFKKKSNLGEKNRAVHGRELNRCFWIDFAVMILH
jgi:hypothetical protein